MIEQAKPCPFCGCEKIHLGHESAMAYHAMCVDCGARTKPFEIPYEWPPEDYEETATELPDNWPRSNAEKKEWEAALKPVENYLLAKAAKAWNRRVK